MEDDINNSKGEASTSPPPFRRSRNLSNRNFKKRNSQRRFSIESHSSIDSVSLSSAAGSLSHESETTEVSSSRSQLVKLHLDTENTARKMWPSMDVVQGETIGNEEEVVSFPTTPSTPDPALLGVRQKVQRFEVFQKDGRKLPIVPQKPAVLPKPRRAPILTAASRNSYVNTSIDEEFIEDDVDVFSDSSTEAEEVVASPAPIEEEENISPAISEDTEDREFNRSDIKERLTATLGRNAGRNTFLYKQNSGELNTPLASSTTSLATKDFPRNYRSTPRPKTEIVGTTNRTLIGKYSSFNYGAKEIVNSPEEDEEQIELRDKCDKYVHPILEELIKTEESYIENLTKGLLNYGTIFQRKDLPIGLKGKKFVLLGNIEQICHFHRNEFLPMLYRNRRDLKRLFEEFQEFIEQNCFYSYVIFTMNKKRSLQLCDIYKNYFKLIQLELDDKLGINSFLVQPIQRMARYPLMLKEFLKTLFDNRDTAMKPVIESCCRLERKIRQLLTTSNESESINDIEECNEFNVFYQGKFQTVSEFNVYDYTLKRTYRSKVFIFDKCIIYTEIKNRNQLIFHGRYPCEHIGISSHSKYKSFTLFYQKRKQQECDFHADPAQIEQWIEHISIMINVYAKEERQKLQERYSRESDHMHRKVNSLSLYRDSNRFSSDSGIGNIWTLPKPEMGEDATSNRTTWYAVS